MKKTLLLAALFFSSVVSVADAAVFTRNIAYGTRGDLEVRQLQSLLATQGFYKGKIDGDYLGATFRAVLAFQRSAHIDATGFFGPMTRARADQLLPPNPAPVANAATSTTQGAATGVFSRDLAYGAKNDPQVKLLQAFLAVRGFFTGEITGNFFAVTRQAVAEYQSKQGIHPTGYFGPMTRARATIDLASLGGGSSSVSPVGTITAPVAVASGGGGSGGGAPASQGGSSSGAAGGGSSGGSSGGSGGGTPPTVSLVPSTLAISSPTQVQINAPNPSIATVAVDPSLSVQWSVSGAVIASGASSMVMRFVATGTPLVALHVMVTDGVTSVSADRVIVALPFAPRDYVGDVKSHLSLERSEIAAEIAAGDSNTYVGTGYFLEGMALAAEASGDTALMGEVASDTVAMIGHATSTTLGGNTYRALAPLDGNGRPQQNDSFAAEGPMAHVAAIIYANPSFLSIYKTQADQIIAFVDSSVFKLWFDKQNGVYAHTATPWPWLGGEFPWGPVAQGGWGSYSYFPTQALNFGIISSYMYSATKSPLYLEYAQRAARSFQTHLVATNGHWMWDAGQYTNALDPGNLDGAMDTSHANRAAEMLNAMYEAGVVFTSADIDLMAHTLTDVLWNGNATNLLFANYIDGGNQSYRAPLYPTPGSNGQVYTGWSRLGRYSLNASRLLALTQQLMESSTTPNATIAINMTPAGLIDMAGALAEQAEMPSLTLSTLAATTTGTNTVTMGGACAKGLTIFVVGTDTSNIPCVSGAWSYTTAAQTRDGVYAYQFYEVDPTGRLSSVATTWTRFTAAFPVAPVVSAPYEVEESTSTPYVASVNAATSSSVAWSIAGGTFTSATNTRSVAFLPGGNPFVTLHVVVSNPLGATSTDKTLVALPFAPRDHLADFRAELATYRPAIQTEVNSGNAVSDYYYTSYYLHGMASAAEASGDSSIMGELLGYEQTMMSLATTTSYKGISYPEWGPLATSSYGWMPDQLSTFQGVEPLARTAAIIYANPVFKAQYKTQADQLIAFVDQSVFGYWFDKQNGIYAHPTGPYLGGTVPWLPVALDGWGTYPEWNDKCTHLATIATYMYEATGDPLYREYADRIAQAFRQHVSVQNGSWIWDFGTMATSTDNPEPTHDTSHANREPFMVMSMFENGIDFGLPDVQSMASTLVNVIWNQDASNPMFNNYIDGANLPFRVLGPWRDGNIYLGWDVLGRYSPAAQRVLDIADDLIESTTTLNLSLASNAEQHGRVELPAMLLRNTLP